MIEAAGAMVRLPARRTRRGQIPRGARGRELLLEDVLRGDDEMQRLCKKTVKVTCTGVFGVDSTLSLLCPLLLDKVRAKDAEWSSLFSFSRCLRISNAITCIKRMDEMGKEKAEG